jgi:hypothetical protein
MFQNTTLGYYTVGDLNFKSKAEATIYASKSNQPLTWIFHPDVWRNFVNNRPQLGVTPLDTLYKVRAQQLRDKYDYLILHYSGGSDSHNILMTFLKNGIKLDEVCTFRSEEIESKIYTPNTQNKNAENIFSEWDYVTKPSLEWLAANHPEIKITVTDMFKTPIDRVLNDDTFNNVDQYISLFELLRRKAYSENQVSLLNKGKNVGNIFGIDKPAIVKMGRQCFMAFTDGASILLDKIEHHDVNNELFYWSIDMPQLPFEQAYRLFQYFTSNPNKQYLIEDSYLKSHPLVYVSPEMLAIQKQAIYTTWDHNKFQAGRSLDSNTLVRGRDNYYLRLKEFTPMLEQWKYYHDEWAKSVDNKFWFAPLKQKICNSLLYFIGMFDD